MTNDLSMTEPGSIAGAAFARMSSMASGSFSEGPVTVRPRSGWVFVLLTMLLTVPTGAVAFMPVRSSTPALATTAVVVTVIAYIYFVAPRIVIDEETIRVENSWREHVVPWGALVQVETRFALTLVTPDGSVHAQAAPGPGLPRARRSRPDGAREGRGTRHQEVDDAHGAGVAGALATVIRGHVQDLRQAGTLDTTAQLETSPRVTHLSLTLGGLALVAVLWLLA